MAIILLSFVTPKTGKYYLIVNLLVQEYPTTLVANKAELAWNKCLEVIRGQINDQSFKTWFEPIIPYRLLGEKLIIQVPSQFFYEWLEDHYVHLLRKALDHAIGKHGQLEYSIVVDSQTSGNKTGKPQTPVNELKTKESPIRNSFLNPNYHFDNFIEGDCNRLARAASYAVAERPSQSAFNPLMIYGGVGLGKTHLVQAIGNHINYQGKADRKMQVLYVSSEKFTSHFIGSIRENNLQNFMDYYMEVDVLIIDDIQFLSGKEKTQESFFHIFNHLHQSGKQIILTSDRPPRDLEGMEDRLLSRFKWGLTADLQSPDFETRIAIIQKKIQEEGIDVDTEVIEYLAHSISSNVRELEGVMVSLIAQASLTRRTITLDLAKQTLNHIVADNEKEANIDTIITTVSEAYKVSIMDLKSKSRLRNFVIPRQVAMCLAKEFTNLSLKAIGYHFGGRDHSTVIHALQTISNLSEVDKDLKSQVDKLRSQFKRS